MTTLRITVQARSILFMPAIFGSSIGVGQQAQVADGVTITNYGGDEYRSGDIPLIFHFTLEFAKPIAEAVIATVVSAWLVAKLKPYIRPERGDKVTIERTVVELEQGEVARVITEKLTSETTIKQR